MKWDQAGYAMFVAPSVIMSNSAKAIVDLTLASAFNGASNANLLYDLVIAEMDAAVARYYVALNTGINKERKQQ